MLIVPTNLTGLIWLKNANCTDTLNGIDPTTSSNKLTWANANIWIAKLANGSCGLSDSSSSGDWRLPSVNELQSLISYGYVSPALSNPAGTAKWTEGDAFTGVQTSDYWSSTSYAGSPGLGCRNTKNIIPNFWLPIDFLSPDF
jgi:hypothetical protein